MKATSGNNKKAVLNVVKYIIYYFKELPTIVVGSSLEFLSNSNSLSIISQSKYFN